MDHTDIPDRRPDRLVTRGDAGRRQAPVALLLLRQLTPGAKIASLMNLKF